MAWTIEFERQAERDLEKLDRQVARRILRYLAEQVAPLEDPRSRGVPLKGDRLGTLWRYRVGDYRVIASLEEERLRVLVVRIGHRRSVYR